MWYPGRAPGSISREHCVSTHSSVDWRQSGAAREQSECTVEGGMRNGEAGRAKDTR